MEQENLVLSMTTDQDFPEEKHHIATCFLSCSEEFNSGRGVQFREMMHIMAKTPKAKAKPAPKRLKAENSR